MVTDLIGRLETSISSHSLAQMLPCVRLMAQSPTAISSQTLKRHWFHSCAPGTGR